MGKRYDKPKIKNKEPREVKQKKLEVEIPRDPEPEIKKEPDRVNLYAGIKTTGELEAALKSRHPNLESVDFKGLDLEMVRDTSDEYSRMAEEHPEEAATVKSIGRKPELLKSYRLRGVKGSIAYVVPLRSRGSGGSIGSTTTRQFMVLSPTYYGKGARPNFDYQMKLSADTKFHPASAANVRGIITHEFGHVVHNYYENEESPRYKSITPNKSISSGGVGSYAQLFWEWKETSYRKSKTDQLLAEKSGHYPDSSPLFISTYGNKNSNEHFAESFAALKAGDTSSRNTRQLDALLKARKNLPTSTKYDDTNAAYSENKAAQVNKLNEILDIK